MKLLLHTIALEPARWTPARVSQSLIDLAPRLASRGFRELEIFEPHLATSETPQRILDAFNKSDVIPMILSSYLNIGPATSDDALEPLLAELRERVNTFGFQKIRL